MLKYLNTANHILLSNHYCIKFYYPIYLLIIVPFIYKSLHHLYFIFIIAIFATGDINVTCRGI